MTKQQILERAITNAIDGGWKLKRGDIQVTEIADVKIRAKNTWHDFGYESIVFSHDFAKALWGRKLLPT